MKIHKLPDTDNVVLLELEPTKHLQLWNTWELYELLLESNKPILFEVEDFPIELDKLKEYANKLIKDE